MKNYQSIFTCAALTAAASLLLTNPALAADFTDGSSIVNKEAVTALADLGVISGKPDGSFNPEGTTRRAELAKMLSLLLDPDGGESPSSGFTDVTGTWAEKYIDHCYSLGIISGRGKGTFAPYEAVSGTETARMILSAAGYDTSGYTGAGWAERVNESAKAAGLYDNFTADPSAPLTRDNAALLLYNGLPLLSGDVYSLGFTTSGIAALPDGSLLLTDTFDRVVCQLKGSELDIYAGAVTAAEDVNGRPLGGYYDGARLESTFKLPWAAAPFLDGWAVSDAENNVLRLIRDGQVETINPSASGSDKGALLYPTGLAAAPDGSLYVSDTHNGLIRRITPDGKMTTVKDGLDSPMGLCWAGGALYVAETGGNRILRLNENGSVTVAAGSGEDGGADGAASSAAFSAPQGVAVAEDGTVYVSDTGNSAVRRIRDGQVDTLLRRDPGDSGSLWPVSPAGLLLQEGKLYVCDSFAGVLVVMAV